MSNGSGRRPFSPQSQFDQSFDMIFKAKELCGLCKKDATKCGCCPTDDGPGQDESKDAS